MHKTQIKRDWTG